MKERENDREKGRERARKFIPRKNDWKVFKNVCQDHFGLQVKRIKENVYSYFYNV